MVAGVHYFATAVDHASLLDYLGEPRQITLHRWPIYNRPEAPLTRDEALVAEQVAIVSELLGGPVAVDDSALSGGSVASVFNRINIARLKPSAGAFLIDSNRSPVLFWRPARASADSLCSGEIGSQADAMATISPEYERWARRVMARIRTTGTKVWGLERSTIRPDLKIEVPHISAVYALPAALAALESGATGS